MESSQCLNCPLISVMTILPITKRQHYSWPGGKRLAFYIAINIEHFAFQAGLGMDPHNRTGPQTSRNFAWRDYGNRVGIWRLFDILDELKLPASILLNSAGLLRISGDLREDQRARRRRARPRPHQCRSAARHVGRRRGARDPGMRRCHRRSMSACVRPAGWARARPKSSVTPDLLKEAGFTHLLDWPVDDQPIWMKTRAGPLLSVPYPMELNDAGTLALRDHTGREFADMIVDQFEEMLEALRKAAAGVLAVAARLHSSASRSGCGRCGRRSSIASSTSTRTRSGSRARAKSPSTAMAMEPRHHSGQRA